MQDCSVFHPSCCTSISSSFLSAREGKGREDEQYFPCKVAAFDGDVCLPRRVYQLSAVPRGASHVFPAAFRSQQSSDFSDEELPGEGRGAMLLPAHMPPWS